MSLHLPSIVFRLQFRPQFPLGSVQLLLESLPQEGMGLVQGEFVQVRQSPIASRPLLHRWRSPDYTAQYFLVLFIEPAALCMGPHGRKEPSNPHPQLTEAKGRCLHFPANRYSARCQIALESNEISSDVKT